MVPILQTIPPPGHCNIVVHRYLISQDPFAPLVSYSLFFFVVARALFYSMLSKRISVSDRIPAGLIFIDSFSVRLTLSLSSLPFHFCRSLFYFIRFLFAVQCNMQQPRYSPAPPPPAALRPQMVPRHQAVPNVSKLCCLCLVVSIPFPQRCCPGVAFRLLFF